jgi:elongation factor Ts
MSITPDMVRDLRERTGAGLMDCKRALETTKGDLEAAIDHLRKQGLKSADKKADRAMGEGRVHAVIGPDARTGAMVALTCETDFVAKTPDFDKLIEELAAHVLEQGPDNAEAMLDQKFAPTGTSVGEAIKATVGKLGENIQVARVQRYENARGRVGCYVHHNAKVGALISVTTEASADKAADALKSVCMHAAAMKPTVALRKDVPAETVERERAIFMDEVKAKPADIQEKIAKGKLEKFYADTVLAEQVWFKDDSKRVAQAVEDMLGKGSAIEAFVRFEIGS